MPLGAQQDFFAGIRAIGERYYGEDFSSHLEHEITDGTLNAKLALNVIFNGLVARVRDIGLSKVDVIPEKQKRAAIGTSFSLGSLVAVFALSLWGRVAIQWNAWPKGHVAVADTVTTGALTLTAGLLATVLVLMVGIVAALVVRQGLRRRSGSLAKPSVLALSSGALLLYIIGTFTYLPGELRTISWTHPGYAIRALGGLALNQTNKWADLRVRWIESSSFMRSTDNVLALLAMASLVAVFASAVTSLWRRVEMPKQIEQLGSILAKSIASLSAVFFATCFAWTDLGGSFENRNYALPLSRLSNGIDLAVLALFTVSVCCLAFRLSTENGRISRSILVRQPSEF